MRLAVFSLSAAISSSVTFSGMTMMRISRPAWIAYTLLTPV